MSHKIAGTVAFISTMIAFAGNYSVIAADTTNVSSASTCDTTAAPASAAVSSTSSTTTISPAAAAESPTAETANGAALPADSTQKLLWHKGQSVSIDTATEDILPTYDVALARRQVEAYPDSPEASFILAVALSRTSAVEEALQEVQRARKLAEKQGGAKYFDKMIASYEKMLVSYPEENKVRYGLAWAYYMKAYLLASQSRHLAAWKAANPQLVPVYEAARKKQLEDEAAAAANGGQPGAAPTTGSTAPAKATQPTSANATTGNINKQVVDALHGSPTAAAAALASLASGPAAGGQKPALASLPHIHGIMENVDPGDIPQISEYFDKALQKLDEILKREPNDVWTIDYRAHLKAEYTGNLTDAMSTWISMTKKYPNNPAAYFFLGEGYLKQGNLKESINNVSRALFLRAM